MTARAQQSYTRPIAAAIAEGATSPNPGVANAIAYSTATGLLMRWTGTAWTGLGVAGYATTAKYGVD